MAMTRMQIVKNSEAYVDWWTKLGVDTVACLTVDPRKWRPKHHAQVVKAVKTMMSRVGYSGHADGVVERGVDGTWHAHLAFESGSIDNEALRSSWYLKNGKAMVRGAGSRLCGECHDRPACSWKRLGVRGCGDLEYVARKMHLDRRDAGAIVEIDGVPPVGSDASQRAQR